MLLRKQAEEIISNASNTPGVTGAVVLGVAACAWLVLRSSSDDNKLALKGLKEVPAPKGALPYVGKIIHRPCFCSKNLKALFTSGHLLLLDDLPTKQFKKWHDELGINDIESVVWRNYLNYINRPPY